MGRPFVVGRKKTVSIIRQRLDTPTFFVYFMCMGDQRSIYPTQQGGFRRNGPVGGNGSRVVQTVWTIVALLIITFLFSQTALIGAERSTGDREHVPNPIAASMPSLPCT